MTIVWPLYSPEMSEARAAGWVGGRGASLTRLAPYPSQPQAGVGGVGGRPHSPWAEGHILHRASR